jgi:hypothetical protein
MGGSSALGGAGGSGAANTGGGGGGGFANGTSANAGSGGGSGGYVKAIITNPLPAYAWTVGSGGTAGTAGSGGGAGGAGGSGIIVVTENYANGAVGTATNVTGIVAAANGGTGLSSPGTAGNVLVSTGSGWTSGTPSGGGAYLIHSSVASPTSIVATSGLAITATDQRGQWYIQGSGGAVTVTASPQISAGSIIGQELMLDGVSDTNSVTFTNGSGLALNGNAVLGSGNVLTLFWNGSVWQEQARNF